MKYQMEGLQGELTGAKAEIKRLKSTAKEVAKDGAGADLGVDDLLARFVM